LSLLLESFLARPCRSRAAWLAASTLLVASLLGCSGTGDGGTGDPPSAPIADPCGGGERLPNVVVPAAWLDPTDKTSTSCAYPADRNVNLSGLRIIAIDKFDETNDGSTGNYYVQEACTNPLGPYSGMTAYAPSFSPPDLRLADGDVVDMLGNFSEFKGPSNGPFPYCRTLPEVGGTMTFRFELGPDITPTTIPLSDLKTYDTARQWLGMLVRLEGVTVFDVVDSASGRYAIRLDIGGGVSLGDYPGISNELFDLKGQGPKADTGTNFKSVTGIITYFYGFKIAPRSPADLVLQ